VSFTTFGFTGFQTTVDGDVVLGLDYWLSKDYAFKAKDSQGQGQHH